MKLSSTMEIICIDQAILLGGKSLYTKTKVIGYVRRIWSASYNTIYIFSQTFKEKCIYFILDLLVS